MLTIYLQGGLGNQMFEYASAKAFAKKTGAELRLDLSIFEIHKHKSWCRPYAMDIFAINNPKRISTSLFEKTKLHLLARPKQCLSTRLLKKIHHIVDDESVPETSERMLKNATLYGYFAKEKYFKDIRDELLKDFRFAKPLDERNSTIAQQMQETNSVSVHIRRGDYLNVVNSKVFAQVTPDWYVKAIQLMKEKTGATHFYFFSDDIEWCRTTFSNIENASFIDWNTGKESYRDMQLMSLCKHNIIPNSTFSWWGAWLNNNPQKIVVAPKHYFVDEQADNRKRESMPKDWILM